MKRNMIALMIAFVLILVVFFVAGCTEDSGDYSNNGNNNDDDDDEVPNVALILTSEKTTYKEAEDIVLTYKITNYSYKTIWDSEYDIEIVRVLNENELVRYYKFEDNLGPWAWVNGTVDIIDEPGTGDHLFTLTFYEITDVGSRREQKSVELTITIVE